MRQFTGQADKLGDHCAMPSCQVACHAVNAGPARGSDGKARRAMRADQAAADRRRAFDRARCRRAGERQPCAGRSAGWRGKGSAGWQPGGMAICRRAGRRFSALAIGRRHTGAGIRTPAYGRLHTGAGTRAPVYGHWAYERRHACADASTCLERRRAPTLAQRPPRFQRIAIGLSRAASIKAPSSSDTSSWVKDSSASLSPSCR